mgnify:CR=1 FL=1
MTQIITLLDVILMVTAEFSLQKQMEICTFNFMHLTFTIVLLVFLLLIQSNKIRGLSQGPFILLPNSLLQIHLLLLIRLYSIHILHLLLK